MQFKVRRLVPQDKSSIIKILEDTPAFIPEEVQVAAELIDCYLEDAEGCGYFYYVAEQEGKVAGYICYGPTPLTKGTWDVYWLATAPGLRGQGIGSSLLEMAERDIRSSGGRLILIETSSNPNYEAARKFYLGHSYLQVSTIPDFYSPGDNKITFWKAL